MDFSSIRQNAQNAYQNASMPQAYQAMTALEMGLNVVDHIPYANKVSIFARNNLARAQGISGVVFAGIGIYQWYKGQAKTEFSVQFERAAVMLVSSFINGFRSGLVENATRTIRMTVPRGAPAGTDPQPIRVSPVNRAIKKAIVLAWDLVSLHRGVRVFGYPSETWPTFASLQDRITQLRA